MLDVGPFPSRHRAAPFWRSEKAPDDPRGGHESFLWSWVGCHLGSDCGPPHSWPVFLVGCLGYSLTYKT